MSNKSRHRSPRPPTYSVYAIDTGHCEEPGRSCVNLGRPWSYTVGLSRRGFPELVTTGLINVEVIAHLTSQVVHQIVDHRVLASLPDDRLVEVFGISFRLDNVPEVWALTDPSRIGCWHERIGRGVSEPPRLMQIVWPDDEGRFPDDPLCGELERERQILLSVDPLSYPPPSGLDHVA